MTNDEKREEEEPSAGFSLAGEILTQAGFVEWGQSDAHGLSCYYIVRGSECEPDFVDRVRIRVSDHYARPGLRCSAFRSTTVDFHVTVYPDATRQQIEEATRAAIQEHADYLVSDDFQKMFAEERRALLGSCGLSDDDEEEGKPQ